MSARNRLTELCMGLPEVTATPVGDGHVQFAVRGRTFAYFLDDHHGDGITALHCKAGPGENAQLAGDEPTVFHLPSYLATRGWVGMRLDDPPPDWDRVESLVVGSYRLIAPKRLVARL